MSIHLLDAVHLRGTVTAIDQSHRLTHLRRFASFLAAALLAKVLVTILAEYRWYFPPNFDSAFLIGRRESFVGLYRTAFYGHIISGPLTIVIGSYLLLSRGRAPHRRLHRWGGRIQILIVLLIVVPTGLVMAGDSHAGPVAGYGFAALSIMTAMCAVATAWQAWAGQWKSHQRWASRCFLLLCSPLLLRLIAGAAIVLQLESDEFYRINAWVSWLIPLGIYELWRHLSERHVWQTKRFAHHHRTQQAYP